MNVRAFAEAGLIDAGRSGPAITVCAGLIALGLLFHTEVVAAVTVWQELDGVQPLLPGDPDRPLPDLGPPRHVA